MTNVFQPNVFQPNVFQVGTLTVVTPDVVTKHHKWLSLSVPGFGRMSGVPAFAVSRDGAGILLGVRDKAAPQFAVSRDAEGLLLSVVHVPCTYTVLNNRYNSDRAGVQSSNLYGGSSREEYEGARAGSLNKFVSPLRYVVGQGLDSYYVVEQAYLRFDTNDVIPPGETVVGATLTMGKSTFNQSAAGFIIEARVYNCGPLIETSDFVAGNDLAEKPLFGTFDTAIEAERDPYGTEIARPFTEAAGAAAAINTSGVTGLLLCSDQTRLDVVPTTWDFFSFLDLTESVYLTITTNGPA